MSGPLQLVIDVEVSQIMANLQQLDLAMNPDEIARDASTIILNNTRARYLREVDPDGHPWKPSDAGILRRLHGGTGTLFDTGTLWRSIQEPEGSGAQLSLFGDVAERVITAGAYNAKGVEYGHFHQEGTKHLPVRRFMGINAGDVELFEQRLLQRAARALEIE